MFKMLYPYAYLESVFAIDYAKLYAQGYRGLIFDIDNTLVHHGADSTPEVDALFQMLRQTGFKTLLLSNNEEKRVKRFAAHIDTLYVCEAGKPAADGYRRALAKMQIKREEALCIGDQLFTDILGANRSGLASILVRFIRLPGETKIGKRRRLENVILWFYQKNRHCQNRLGDIHKKEVDA